MTRDELVEKMARAICCVNGCLYPRACDMEIDTAQERLHEASAALSVVTEWLEEEAKEHKRRNAEYTTAPSIYSVVIHRLIAVTKGEQ